MLNMPNADPEGIHKAERLTPSPTMPSLEDAGGGFFFNSENPIRTTGIWEQAAPVQNFPRSDKNKAALSHWVEVAKNDNSRPLRTTGTRQPERGKNQNNGIAKRDTEMESHEESARKYNKAYSDMLSRLRQR